MNNKRIIINPRHYLDRMYTGDNLARDELIMKFLPRVRKLIDSLEISEDLREDVIQVAMLAVIEAVEQHNYQASSSFTTLAYHKIMRSISKYLNSIMLLSGFNIRRLTKDEILAIMTSDSKEELASSLNAFSPEEYEYMFLTPCAYRDEEYSEEEISLENIAIDNVELEELLSRLSPKKREILILSYGLDGEKPKSDVELAGIFHVSPACISDHRRQALKKSKKHILQITQN